MHVVAVLLRMHKRTPQKHLHQKHSYQKHPHKKHIPRGLLWHMNQWWHAGFACMCIEHIHATLH